MWRSLRRWAQAAILGGLAIALTACGGDDDDAASSTRAPTAELAGSITVFAASSLTDAFTTLAEQFEEDHPSAEVVDNLNFAASSDLVGQIAEGAPADAFASADEANMTKVVDSDGTAGDPVVFARNQLAIAVEPDNPLGIMSLADLADPDVRVVLCAETVPCGRFADEALAAAGVRVSPVSREANVRDTLGKVGEADAAIVYATDVTSGTGIAGIEIPAHQNVIATLPIVAVKESANPEHATEWVNYVTSPEAQQILTEEFGFLAP